MNIQHIEISKIRIDQNIQCRAEVHTFAIDDYAEKYHDDSDRLPPVIVYFDGSGYWLADGFHRITAAKQAGLTYIDCDVVAGGEYEALIYALGANSDHGIPRTNADKAKAVTKALAMPELAGVSQRKIAEMCCVSHTFVNKLVSGNISTTQQQQQPSQDADEPGELQPEVISTTVSTPPPEPQEEDRQTDTTTTDTAEAPLVKFYRDVDQLLAKVATTDYATASGVSDYFMDEMKQLLQEF